MKKSVFAILLALMLVVSSGAMAMTAGTYEAEAQGMMGMVKVAVTVSETAIEKVEVVAQNETPGISDPAIANVPAAIVEAQSLAVDTVASATVTSNAILTAAEAALTAAGADIEDPSFSIDQGHTLEFGHIVKSTEKVGYRNLIIVKHRRLHYEGCGFSRMMEIMNSRAHGIIFMLQNIAIHRLVEITSQR